MGHLAMESKTEPSSSAPPFHISSLLGLNSTTTAAAAGVSAPGGASAPSSTEGTHTAASTLHSLNMPVAGMSVAFPLGDRTFPRYFVASPTTHLLLWANGYSVPLSAAAPTCTVRRRKSRTVFSEEQLLLLEESFQRNHYLSTSERQSIAQKLCLSEQQVKTWFQNRRTKLRRSDPSALLDSRCVDS